MDFRRLCVLAVFALAALAVSAQDLDAIVVTGTTDGAGTDASVYLILFGKLGTSPETNLATTRFPQPAVIDFADPRNFHRYLWK